MDKENQSKYINSSSLEEDEILNILEDIDIKNQTKG